MMPATQRGRYRIFFSLDNPDTPALTLCTIPSGGVISFMYLRVSAARLSAWNSELQTTHFFKWRSIFICSGMKRWPCRYLRSDLLVCSHSLFIVVTSSVDQGNRVAVIYADTPCTRALHS